MTDLKQYLPEITSQTIENGDIITYLLDQGYDVDYYEIPIQQYIYSKKT